MAERDFSHHEEAAVIIPKSITTGPDGEQGTIAEVIATSPETADRAMEQFAEDIGTTIYRLDDGPRQASARSGKTFGFGVKSWRASWIPEGDKQREAQKAARASEALRTDAALCNGIKRQRPPQSGPSSN